MRRTVLGVVLGFVLLAVLAFVFLWSGLYNAAAINPPGVIERKIANFALDHSIAHRAGDAKNPEPAGPDSWQDGLMHYKDDCLVCHAAPGVEKSDIARGLNPPAPALDHRGTQTMSDAEMYWVIANGVRMTGMPAFGPSHPPAEIWHLVAFIRHLPNLGPDEISSLKTGEDKDKAGEGGRHE